MSARASESAGPPAAPGGQPPASAPVVGMVEIAAVVRELALILYNNLHQCWLSDSDRNNSMVDGLAVVSIALEKHHELRFAVHESELRVNGLLVEMKHERDRALVKHLQSVDANNFTFAQGVTQQEFGDFIELLCRRAATLAEQGGFAAAAAESDLANIHVKKVVFREVSDNETVIAKREAAETSAQDRQAVESKVLEYLSGDADPDDPKAVADIADVAQDSQHMAGLVIRAAEKKQGAAGTLDKALVAGTVADCLRRTFQGLMKDPASHTPKGTKSIEKTLCELEKDILTHLGLEPGQQEGKPISKAVSEMTNHLQIQTIADEYAKKVKALEASEKRILRFVKMHGLDAVSNPDLEKQLSDEGLDVSGWHRLLALSEAPLPGEGADADLAESAKAVSQLAALIDGLQVTASAVRKAPDTQTSEQLAGQLQQVGTQVEAMAEQTRRKIDGFVAAVSADIDAVEAIEEKARQEGKGPRLSRRQMVRVLAEIVQELLQPLSVISSSLELVTSKTLGEVTRPQSDILKLAIESADRIKILIATIEKIAGFPKTLTPDANLLRAIYGHTDKPPAP